MIEKSRPRPAPGARAIAPRPSRHFSFLTLEFDVFEVTISTPARTGPRSSTAAERQAHRSDRRRRGRDRGQYRSRMGRRDESNVLCEVTGRDRTDAAETTAGRNSERLLLGDSAPVLHRSIHNDVVSTRAKSARHLDPRIEQPVVVHQGVTELGRGRMRNDRHRRSRLKALPMHVNLDAGD